MPQPAQPGSTAERVSWVLSHCQTIAVVGLSPKPHRASFDVAQYMQSRGYRIIPINPNAQEVLGEKAYASLSEAAEHEQIDLVNCFRNSEDIAPIVDEALSIGARALWLQLGIRDDESVHKAVQAGLVALQDRCIKIDHKAVAGGQVQGAGSTASAAG
jgi:predicted CoA-binding protein